MIVFEIISLILLSIVWIYCIWVSLTSRYEKESKIFGFYNAIVGFVLGIILTVLIIEI